MHQTYIKELRPTSNQAKDLFFYCIEKAIEKKLLSCSYMHLQWAKILFDYEKNSTMRSDLMSKVKREYSLYFTRDSKYAFIEEKLKRDFPELFGISDEESEEGYTCDGLVDVAVKTLRKEIIEQKNPDNMESFKGEDLQLIKRQNSLYIYSVKLRLHDGQEPHFHDSIPFKLNVFGNTILCEAIDYDYIGGHLFFTSSRYLNSASYCKILMDSTFVLEGLIDRLNEIKANGIDEDLPFTKFLFDETRIIKKVPHKKVDGRISSRLDSSQKAAFDAAINNDITFIWGPPGTGKSFTLASIIYALFDMEEERTAVCCLSNVAVDQLLSKVLDIIDAEGIQLIPGNMYRAGRTRDRRILSTDYLFPEDDKTFDLRKKIKRYSDELDMLKSQKRDMTDYGISVKAELIELSESLKNHTDYLVNNSRVVFSTISNFVLSNNLSGSLFDNLIVDEASMLAMPSLIALGNKISKRLIMVGDFQQLSPIAIVKDEFLTDSVFEMNGINILNTQHPALYQLLNQRRSNEKLVKLINGIFYNEKLIPIIKGTNKVIDSVPHKGHVIAIETVQDGAVRFTKGGTRQNKKSAEHVIQLLSTFSEDEDSHSSIGVITPYKGQVSLLKALFHEWGFSDEFEKRIKIGTIHTFQGSECDVIIYDMVDCPKLESGKPSRIGRLYTGNEGERLLNVAVSRARHKLIVVCNADYLQNIPGDTVTYKTRKVLDSLSRYRY